MLFCFFKQKTAYEMRISAWSSDVCSSDLAERTQQLEILEARDRRGDGRCGSGRNGIGAVSRCRVRAAVDKAVNSCILQPHMRPDRKSVVSGKGVSVRVDLGGRRFIKKNTLHMTTVTIHKTR